MNKKIHYSGLGIELGQMHRGLTASPEKAKEYFNILENAGLEIQDCGSLGQSQFQPKVKFFNESDLKKIKWDYYFEAFEKTKSLLEGHDKNILLNWGGDHSVAMSTVGAFVSTYIDGYVIWIDAHADLNLPSYSLTGNLHGMPMAILLNLNNISNYHFKWLNKFLNPEKLIYVGLRDLDPFEEESIEKLNIKAFTRRRVRKWGIENVLNEIIHTIKDHPVHISFDIDSVDPRIAPSTGVPVNDGLSAEDLHSIGTRLSQCNLKSIDMVELNPSLGTSLQVDQTFITAMHFLKTLLTYPGGFNESMGERTKTDDSFKMEWTI